MFISQKFEFSNNKTYFFVCQAEFDILEASDVRIEKKILQTVGEQWRQFKSDLTSKWVLAANKDSVNDTVCEKYGINNEKWTQFCQSRRDPSWEVYSLSFSLFSSLNLLIIIHCNHEFHE